MSEDYGELVKEWEREGYDLPLDLRLHADEAEQLHKPSWAMFLRMVADTVVSLQSRADQLAADRDSANAERFDALRSRDLAQAAAERLTGELVKANEGALEGIARQYHELLYAVANKHPGETRHETALRYIRQAEAPCNEAKAHVALALGATPTAGEGA